MNAFLKHLTGGVRTLLNKRFFRSSESRIKRITDIDVLKIELIPVHLYLSGCLIHRILYYLFLHHYISGILPVSQSTPY